MKKTKTIFVFALLMMLNGTILFGFAQSQDVGIQTKAQIMIGFNPIGLGQSTNIVFGVLMPPPGAEISENTPRWEKLTLTITKPDGTIETKSNIRSDSTGLNYITFTPTTVGTYKFQTSFPGQTIAGVYYKPSTSSQVDLIVQQEPIKTWVDTPLPTEYWARPIYSQNREWWRISSNWLGLGGGSHGVGSYGPDQNPFNPNSAAPKAPHIVWTKELTMGGLVGGEFDTLGYYGGLPYEARFHPPIIIDGKLYYNLYDVQRYQRYPGFTCVDLATGETLWTKEGTTISKGNTIYWGTPNQWGIVPPILWKTWGSPWTAYDAFTGEEIISFVNASTVSVFAQDNNGNLLGYLLNRGKSESWLAMWNGTKAIIPSGIDFRPRPGNYSWNRGIEWNVTIPNVAGNPTIGNINSLINPTVLVCEGFIPETPTNQVHTFVQVAYSLKDGEEGKQLWVANRTDLGERARRANYRNIIGDDVYIVYHREAMHYHGYNIYTGALKWESDPYDTSDWAAYTRAVGVAYGKLLTLGQDGYIAAFNLTNGNLEWKTKASDTYLAEGLAIDAPFGHHPFTTHSGYVIADGTIYAATGEHSPNQPLWRGGQLYALDVESGKVQWRITGWWDCGQPIISDGYIVGFNAYDDRLYGFGKGPSATTITATPKISELGNKILVEGTVTDESPGTKQKEQMARFPDGVPAVSDKNMTLWMEYVYMQQPRPINVNGVEVVISVLDSNNNSYEVGTTTSDQYGGFKFLFKPQIPGEYTVIATFKGSESYWPSQAHTYLSVADNPTPTPEPTKTPATMTEQYFLPATAALVILIVIVLAMLALMMTKKP